MDIIISGTDKCSTFCQVFQHLKLFSANINILFESKRMYIQTMDSYRISIIEIIIPDSWFSSYTISENVCIGVNTNYFFKILASREASQNITIHFDNDNSDTLFIALHSENKAVFDREFELPLIELEAELMSIPSYDTNADVTMCSSNFSSIVGQLKMFGDNVNISCNESKFVLSASSQESGKMNVNIEIDDLNSFAINDGANLELSFSLQYLNNICLYHKISREIEVKLTDGYPLKAIYHLDLNDDSSSTESAKIIFYLAPRVDDNDD